jgi:hypothetical protein
MKSKRTTRMITTPIIIKPISPNMANISGLTNTTNQDIP